ASSTPREPTRRSPSTSGTSRSEDRRCSRSRPARGRRRCRRRTRPASRRRSRSAPSSSRASRPVHYREPPMRRALIVLAVLAVLVAGLVAAIVVHRLREERNVRGSSSVEFTVPVVPAPRPVEGLRIEWPQYGFEAARTRAVSLALRPPFRSVWQYYA